MSERYHVVSTQDSPSTLDSSALADVLAKDGQLLLPMLDLIENAQYAIDDLIDVMGCATIEAVLLMSAAQLAGPKQQGKKSDRDVVYHGSQKGRVPLRERELRVDKPRLRKKNPDMGESGEVEIPAYKAIREHRGLADRMLQILIAGVSTRRYEQVIPEMAETVGVSKSQVLTGDHRGGRTPAQGSGRTRLLEARYPGRLDRRDSARVVPRDLRRGRRCRGSQARSGPP